MHVDKPVGRGAVCLDRAHCARGSFLWTLHLLLAKLRPSPSVAGFWQHGHSVPSRQLSVAEGGGRLKGWKKCWSASLGQVSLLQVTFCSTVMTVPLCVCQGLVCCWVLLRWVCRSAAEKRKEWTFLRKNVLWKSIIHVISRASLFPMFKNLDLSSRFPERNIKLSGKLCNNSSRLILWWVLVLSYF